MFRTFSRLVVALQRIAGYLEGISCSLDAIVQLQKEMGPARDRLAELELSRARFEAEMGALVLTAEGKFKAARNAEARERQLKKSYERLVDDFDPDGTEVEASRGSPDIDYDAQPSEEERLQSLRLDVAPNNKAPAIAAKWGR